MTCSVFVWTQQPTDLKYNLIYFSGGYFVSTLHYSQYVTCPEFESIWYTDIYTRHHVAIVICRGIWAATAMRIQSLATAHRRECSTPQKKFISCTLLSLYSWNVQRDGPSNVKCLLLIQPYLNHHVHPVLRSRLVPQSTGLEQNSLSRINSNNFLTLLLNSRSAIVCSILVANKLVVLFLCADQVCVRLTCTCCQWRHHWYH